jgi:uncharacterized protein
MRSDSSSIGSAADLLGRYHAAIIAQSASDLAGLYAIDAVHEFPFAHDEAKTLHGRDAVRTMYGAAWNSASVSVRAIVNVRIHELVEPGRFIAEQDLLAVNKSTGFEFVASTVLVVRMVNGELAHIRDYTDNLTIAKAMGRAPSVS